MSHNGHYGKSGHSTNIRQSCGGTSSALPFAAAFSYGQKNCPAARKITHTYGKSRTLIGISRPTDDRGEVSEAVRVATQEDQAAYPDAYEAYQATMQQAPWQPASEQPAEAASTETAEEGQS